MTMGSRATKNFYPRSPQGERPASLHSQTCRYNYFYPRSPQGERRFSFRLTAPYSEISIHALRKESDAGSCLWLERTAISIHALRKESDATRPRCYSMGGDISIHALRKESDYTNLGRHRGNNDFYPRSPQGERP